jgi:hypothetical protein
LRYHGRVSPFLAISTVLDHDLFGDVVACRSEPRCRCDAG